MPPGDGFTDAQRSALERVVAEADRATGLRFLLHVGRLDGGREAAQALLSTRGAAGPDTVVVAVDPVSRELEIVTGSRAAERISDRDCGLASLAMTSGFAAGDLVGGLRDGVRLLADRGRRTDLPHPDTI